VCSSGPLALALSAADSAKSAPPASTQAPALDAVSTAAPSKAVAALCAFGVVLGLYAFYVGSMATAPPPVGGRAAKSGFKAWCDFSTGASCSTVARSQYGVGLGLIKPNGPWGFLALPNSLYGVIYYVAMLFTQLPSTFSVPRARQIALILSACALFASFYLGYLLVFVIKNLCVVCVATYLVNGALFKLSMSDYQAVLASMRTKRTSSSAAARAKGLVSADRQARGVGDQAVTARRTENAAKEEDEQGREGQEGEEMRSIVPGKGKEECEQVATKASASEADDEEGGGEDAKRSPDRTAGDEASGESRHDTDAKQGKD